MKAKADSRSDILATCDIYKAHIVDVSLESIVIEITGSEEKIDSLQHILEPFGILEYVKTGLTALERGSAVMSVF